MIKKKMKVEDFPLLRNVIHLYKRNSYYICGQGQTGTKKRPWTLFPNRPTN